jgi:hypothetical protein
MYQQLLRLTLIDVVLISESSSSALNSIERAANRFAASCPVGQSVVMAFPPKVRDPRSKAGLLSIASGSVKEEIET